MSQMGLDPFHILQVGMGFWPSKAVLSAVELELFTNLGSEAMTGEEIGERLGLHPRAIYDFPRGPGGRLLVHREGGQAPRSAPTSRTASVRRGGFDVYQRSLEPRRRLMISGVSARRPSSRRRRRLAGA